MNWGFHLFDGGTNYWRVAGNHDDQKLLNLMDNQHRDLPLLSIMTSPIGNFATTEYALAADSHPRVRTSEAVGLCHRKNVMSCPKNLGLLSKTDDWRCIIQADGGGRFSLENLSGIQLLRLKEF